jgi:hypothetical protein
VYELLTSLDDEVARVWSLKWRLPKVLFMLNRYVIRAILVFVQSTLLLHPKLIRCYIIEVSGY